MSKTNTGGPAFPQPAGVAADGATFFDGMTLRDYFAAAAMQGLLSSTKVMSKPEELAAMSYMVADVMLKARGA